MNTQVDDQNYSVSSYSTPSIIQETFSDTIRFKRLIGENAKIEMINNSEMVFFNNGQSSLRIGNYEPLEKSQFKPKLGNTVTNPAILLYNSDPNEPFALLDIGIEQVDAQNKAYIAFKKDNVSNYAKIELINDNITMNADNSYVVNSDEIINNGFVVSPIENVSGTDIIADDIALNYCQINSAENIYFGESSTNRATRDGFVDVAIKNGINDLGCWLRRLILPGPEFIGNVTSGNLNYSSIRNAFINDEVDYVITGSFDNALQTLDMYFTKFSIAVNATGIDIDFLAGYRQTDKIAIVPKIYNPPIDATQLPTFKTNTSNWLQFFNQPFVIDSNKKINTTDIEVGKYIGAVDNYYVTYSAASLKNFQPLEFVIFPDPNDGSVLIIRDTNIKFMNGDFSRVNSTSTRFKIYIDYANWFKPEVSSDMKLYLKNNLPWVVWLNA